MGKRQLSKVNVIKNAGFRIPITLLSSRKLIEAKQTNLRRQYTPIFDLRGFVVVVMMIDALFIKMLPFSFFDENNFVEDIVQKERN